ncbi:uncharacterized protein F4822DRAFT_412972 [Hypoxylon trugodes]|uniref:uncharacterized protein n=1 Tax=Hypoxylon trugodes TaxID=326681 RepID=UPI0021936F58|nr:uncharacterized protein F4822DRAFT_412972 [Hypoxylon trugodes]KAI1385410.1 hypothetical protein F4822DRAFT_412972 [Hypoxylon trugodes]
MATCGTCWRQFRNTYARQQHMDALDHDVPEHECDRCTLYFMSRSAVVNHMNAKNHWYYDCDFCDETWPDTEALEEHEIEEHLYCADCDRSFTSRNNIRMHRNSRIHRGANMECPFCRQCYTSATGLSHHLENGACPRAPSLNREVVYEIVRSKDPGGLISKNLVGWRGNAPYYEATAQAWNGYAYECYLCHRQFGRLESLNQHLSSPAHKQNLYHCPRRISCGREFTTLAGLMNHLESESCGYTKFENVQQSVRGIVSSDRLIGFR